MYADNYTHHEVYCSDNDKEYVAELVLFVRHLKRMWLNGEFTRFIRFCFSKGITKATLEIYLRLISDATGFKTDTGELGPFESRQWFSLNELHDHILGLKKKQSFDFVKSFDRKLFFGKNGYFQFLIAAGFIVEKDVYSETKYNNKNSAYVLTIPSFHKPVSFKIKKESSNYTCFDHADQLYGRFDKWSADMFHASINSFLQSKEEDFLDFQQYIEPLNDDNIDLISYMQALYEPVFGFGMNFDKMSRLAVKYYLKENACCLFSRNFNYFLK